MSILLSYRSIIKLRIINYYYVLSKGVLKTTFPLFFCWPHVASNFHNVTKNSAMPKSNSNLHHSIERAQIDNSTLLKIENWWLLRVDIPLWSHGKPAILRRWRWGGWKSANFAGRFLYRHDVSGKSGHCYWKNRRWGATLVFEIIFPTNFVTYS